MMSRNGHTQEAIYDFEQDYIEHWRSDEACDLSFDIFQDVLDAQVQMQREEELIEHNELYNRWYWTVGRTMMEELVMVVPAARLVGIEPNPGPKVVKQQEDIERNINSKRRFNKAPSCFTPCFDQTAKERDIAINKARLAKILKVTAQFKLPFITPELDIGLTDELGDKIDDILAGLENFSDKFDINNILTTISDYFGSNLVPATGFLVMIPVYIIIINIALNHPKKYLTGVAVAAILALLSIKTPKELWDQIHPHMLKILRPADQQMRAQVGVDIFADISTVLMMVTGYNILGSVPDGSKLAKGIKMISDFGKSKDGFDTSIITIVSLIEKIVNYFKSDVLGFDRIKIIEETNIEVAKWIDAIEKLCNELHDGSLLINTESSARVFALICKEVDCLQNIALGKNHQELKLQF